MDNTRITGDIVTNNPFTCTTYTISGEVQVAVLVTKRTYGAALVWEDAEAKRCGSTTDKYSTKAGFDAGVAVRMGSAPCATAHAYTIIHEPELDTFLATIRCHDANSEIYSVTISREMITVASYMDDAILAKVETWMDAAPTLAGSSPDGTGEG